MRCQKRPERCRHFTVSYGGNANNKYITTYFRKLFSATNVVDETNLVLKMVVDYGAAVFLNGSAATNENLTAGAAYNTLASPVPVALQSTWQAYRLEPNLLTEGTNTIAAK